jgi:hypothetical protein
MPVQFEEEQNFNKSYDKVVSKKSSGLTDWLIKKGIAKDEKGANSIMIIVMILCFGLTIFFITR